jgi:hypothetical protein
MKINNKKKLNNLKSNYLINNHLNKMKTYSYIIFIFFLINLKMIYFLI